MNAFLQANATPIVFDIAKCRAMIDDLNRMNPGLNLTYKLSVKQCEQYCGKGYGPYGFYDALDAMITWVIPLLALVANMNFTETTRFWLSYGAKFFVIAHQFANPIDTIFSLASKLDLGRRLREYCDTANLTVLRLEKDELANAKRDIANVCYCIDDFGHDQFEKWVNRVFELVQRPYGADIVRIIKTTSRDLALARVRNILRTSIAVVVYVGAAFTALFKTNTATALGFAQPHTIALRELCYFLLLEIVLSAAAEGWPHQWTPQSPLKALGSKLQEYDPDFGWQSLGRKEIEPWNGGIYSYRPQKNLLWRPSGRSMDQKRFKFSSGEGGGRHMILLALAFSSVLMSFGISFMMSWYTPTVGFGGRGIAELTYVVVWIGNFVLDEWIASHIEDRKRLFYWIWAKDTLISFLVILFFFLPFMGWYNSCKSWSASFGPGGTANAYIDLDLGQIEKRHTWNLYFLGIAVGAVLQGVLAFVIIWMNRDACKLAQRTDKENREEFCLSSLCIGIETLAERKDIIPPIDIARHSTASSQSSSLQPKASNPELPQAKTTSADATVCTLSVAVSPRSDRLNSILAPVT